MASPLDSIATQMPVASAKRQKQAQATADFQLQQAVAAAPTPAIPAQAVSALGAESAAGLGKKQVGIAAAAAQGQEQVGQQALQEQQSTLANRISGLRQGVTATELAGEKEFANLDADSKRELFDMRMQFAKDAQGREFMTDRQLQDYMITHARDAEQFKTYQADSERLADRQSQVLDTSLRKISQELERQNSLSIQHQDNQLKLDLQNAKLELQRKIEREKARRAAERGQFTTVTTLIGMGVGAYFGGPAGAAAGGQAGNAAGGMAYDQANKE